MKLPGDFRLFSPNLPSAGRGRPEASSDRAIVTNPPSMKMETAANQSNRPRNTLNYHRIGQIIRKHRNQQRLKLIDLAARTGMGSALLSKIENGRMIPTIPTLFSIIHQLNIPLDSFFSELVKEDEFPGYLHIPRERYHPYVKEEKAVGFNYLSILEETITTGSFQISLLELLPGARRKPVSTDAYEYLYILNGPVRFHLDTTKLLLNTGDSLYFDGRLPHVPVNETKDRLWLLVIYFFQSPGGS